jgi:alkylation response protein AidB-like acyl-CoA dehydrogenase
LLQSPFVDLGLTDEQRELVSSFGNLLSRSSTPEHVRAAEPGGFDATLWDTLRDTGAVVMAVPEANGGWGASLLDLALVAEQIGRYMASAPVIESQIAARLLAALSSEPAQDALERMLGGGHLVTMALHPPKAGVAELTPAGALCKVVIVRRQGILLLASVDSGNRRIVANLASAPLADITLVDPVELTTGAVADAHFDRAIDEWMVLTAAAVVGLSAAAHSEACAYAIERKAFGASIGTYQGVAHPLADDATAIDGSRLLVQKAAWALDKQVDRASELAAMAFAFASETAEQATYNAIHFHGGYGFMLEHDAQLYYRRARGWPRVWGDAEAAHRRAAARRYLLGIGEAS